MLGGEKAALARAWALAFRQTRSAAIFRQCWRDHLRGSKPHQWTQPEGPGSRMKHTVDVLRSSSGSRSNPLAALNCLLGAMVALPYSASAQTAFTLPAPPFELPVLPSVSGSWTVMVGVGIQAQLRRIEKFELQPDPDLYHPSGRLGRSVSCTTRRREHRADRFRRVSCRPGREVCPGTQELQLHRVEWIGGRQCCG
jgi:hypothetical protein